MSRFLAVLSLVLSASACGESGDSCVTGDVSACFCEGGVGTRQCTAGAWNECGSCSPDSQIELGPIGNRGPGSVQGLAMLPGQLDQGTAEGTVLPFFHSP